MDKNKFWEKVIKIGNGGCWRWKGAIVGGENGGYGQFRVGDRRIVAHRVAYELLVGPIPEGLELDHLCRNRWCVNPAHLEPVTHLENMRRAPRWQDKNIKTHCIRGHEYTPENTYVNKKTGARRCRMCMLRRSSKAE